MRLELRLAALACAAVCWPLAAAADPIPDAAKPAAAVEPAAAAPAQPHVAAGAVVDIEVTELISSKVHKIGDKFALKLAYPILLDGKVVVPAGTTGVGQVIDAAPAGALGRPAKLLLAARYTLDFNGAQIKLRTLQLGRVGVDNGDTIMAMSFVPVVGLASMFMHGGEIEIPVGTRAQAKLVADLDIPLPTPDAPTTTEGSKQP